MGIPRSVKSQMLGRWLILSLISQLFLTPSQDSVKIAGNGNVFIPRA